KQIEPVAVRHELRQMPKMPFSNASRFVTGRFQRAGNRDFIRRQTSSRSRIKHMAPRAARHPAAHRQTSRQQRRATRGAKICPRVKIGETQSFSRHTIQVRRANTRMPETTQIAVTKIIGHDDDDVWLFSFDTECRDDEEQKKRKYFESFHARRM